jgi:uncharacterized protein YyaL (SSP411 family)
VGSKFFPGVWDGGRCCGYHQKCEVLGGVGDEPWLRTGGGGKAVYAGAMSTLSANRLAREKSPYLLQHAHNPVDWFPWGEEAFAEARAEDKPIFLSIGYSTCHWCHVMEHESFESAAIAAFLAEHFVSIKVDREERPDVDQVYMTFVQATTGHGGWPMSVWLTPELRPFVGGTYFPPTDLPGRPGFITVLRRIAELWKNERGQVEDKAQSLLSALREVETEAAAEPDEAWSPGKAMQAGFAQYARMYDAQEGGFGGAPKFPRPVNLQFLLRGARRSGRLSPTEAQAGEGMVLHTLRQMAGGGMHDHLGGGFHRYSVDAEWHVPHFEKMLYDQAQLAEVYLAAGQVSGAAFFGGVARKTLDYVRRELTGPEGGFYSAEDADSLPGPTAIRKQEGAFYIWSEGEVREALGPERAQEFNAIYDVEADGNVSASSDPHGELAGTNVLRRRDGPAEDVNAPGLESRLEKDRALLLARRAGRPRPYLDDKIIAAWNGLMIGAFARGAQTLGDAGFLVTAQRAAAFLRDHLYDAASGELRRSYREGPSGVAGFAADYAFLIHGLLELYAADFDPGWLSWARRLQDTLDLRFWDQVRGGYFSTTDGDPAILLRMKEDYDGAEPTPTSVAVHNLWRFSQLYHNEVLLDHARSAVRAFAARLEAQPIGMPLLLAGAALLETPPIQLILHAADPGQAGLAELTAEARRLYLPQMVVIRIADQKTRDYFAPRHPVIEKLPENPTQPAAYLCENFACRLPVTEPAMLAKMLAEF